MKLIKFASAALLAAALGTSATAHASLEQQEAKTGSFYKGVMRIGHGCGEQATLRLRITIPEGVVSVKPMPKPGWALETVTGAYEGSYDYYGKTLTEGVTEIIWTGELAAEHYDEFTFRGKLHDTLEADKTLFFPTVQECADGENGWVEIPAEGQDPHELKRPAPGLHLVAPDAHTH
ncbi:YcnI family copper-binding membrane protein [Parasedimentitalea psychrophila]|uniref:YcnI family protein n=1 Tax=Parasedimentitalea psychrophila TaxID=2997337 RepID=A0A9Y2L144_9RHOB|nr:YcnI family protein [Parasedimentitalea psychrophila]WIY26383.1 YcnI family protein [Parasedimentitalea psychrophila]